MTQFEQLIEHIVNGNEDLAKSLFHEIVVDKSREIYSTLVNEDEFDPAGGDMPADASNDMIGDVEADQEGMDMHSDHDAHDANADDEMSDVPAEGDVEDQVVDLEAKLDELQAEFDALKADMGGEDDGFGGDDMGGDDDMASLEPEGDDLGGDEVADETGDDMPVEGMVREYTEKVAKPENGEGKMIQGGSVSVNTKSVVAGKNDMGGSSKNIVKGGDKVEGAKPKVGDFGPAAVDPRTAGKSAFTKKVAAPSKSEGSVNTTSPINKKA
jgi:hypothetical protein